MTDHSPIVDRMRARLDSHAAMQTLDATAERYGYVEGRQFSFKGHEYQRQIIRDTSSRGAVRKCSQVGMSEAATQKTLAVLATFSNTRVIFTLPTTGMALKFAKDRVDGALLGSDFYRGLTVPANNSAQQKKIGTSMLYIGGTFGDTGAISVPGDVVFTDELDFSSLDIVGKLSSRLRHSEIVDVNGIRGINWKFSTPTLPDYGIDREFVGGTQCYYMARCTDCQEWVVPDYFEDLMVPGFDKPIVDFERFDLTNPMYKVDKTWIRCPACHGDLWRALSDPERRQWVAKYPGRETTSYHISPWDVPSYNTPPNIIRQLGEYRTLGDYLGFVIGLPYQDAENSFLLSEELRQKVIDARLWAYEPHIASQVLSATVMGLDTGKVCHLTVGVMAGTHTHIVWAEKIANSVSNPATPEVLKRVKFFGCVRLCVDAGPDISLANALVAGNRLGHTSAVEYVRSVQGLGTSKEVEDGQIVKADRTKTMTETMKAHNAGRIHYVSRFVDEIWNHLKNVKKIRRQGGSGEDIEFFEAVGEDHFCHSLNYLMIARARVEEGGGGSTGFSMPPMIKKTQVKQP